MINILHALASTDQNHTLLVIKYNLMANRIFFTNRNQDTQTDANIDGEKITRSSAYIR